jgi:hypothetical protein
MSRQLVCARFQKLGGLLLYQCLGRKIRTGMEQVQGCPNSGCQQRSAFDGDRGQIGTIGGDYHLTERRFHQKRIRH